MTYFLWPNRSFRLRALLSRRKTGVARLEARIQLIYPDVFAVLYPSGRSALAALFRHLGLQRPDLVWLPPYSSHCVFDAVARTATPTNWGESSELAAAVVYHQWGFPHEAIFPPSTTIIDDSADTLCAPAGRMFPAGGRFEVFSLSKSLGTFGGGLLLCRKQSDAERLRRERPSDIAFGRLQFALKFTGRFNLTAGRYWAGAEPENGVVPSVVCRDIDLALDQLDDIVDERRRRLERIRPFMPDRLRLDPDRLPSNVPVECGETVERELRRLGLSSGFRRFNRNLAVPVSANTMAPVLPIPLHRQVPLPAFESWLRVLQKARA